jgi:hypothetical protein
VSAGPSAGLRVELSARTSGSHVRFVSTGTHSWSRTNRTDKFFPIGCPLVRTRRFSWRSGNSRTGGPLSGSEDRNFPGSGGAPPFPPFRVSHPSMRRRLKREAPEPEHSQLPEDDVPGITLRPSRGDLVSPPQKVPCTFPPMLPAPMTPILMWPLLSHLYAPAREGQVAQRRIASRCASSRALVTDSHLGSGSPDAIARYSAALSTSSCQFSRYRAVSTVAHPCPPGRASLRTGSARSSTLWRD